MSAWCRGHASLCFIQFSICTAEEVQPASADGRHGPCDRFSKREIQEEIKSAATSWIHELFINIVLVQREFMFMFVHVCVCVYFTASAFHMLSTHFINELYSWTS